MKIRTSELYWGKISVRNFEIYTANISPYSGYRPEGKKMIERFLKLLFKQKID